MTKALLTQNDLKLFILDTIQSKVFEHSVFLTKNAFCLKFNISKANFNRLIKNGLRYSYIKGKTKYYDVEKTLAMVNKFNVKRRENIK